MNKKTLSRTGVLLLSIGLTPLATNVAMAQTSDADTVSTEPTTTETAEPPTDGTTVVESDEPARPVEGQITLQGENTMLSSVLVGSTVHSSGEEAIGDIDDLIINLDGTVEGAVIGVGGFLGIGEKEIAVEMSKLSITMTPEDEPRLLLDATREDLEAAPEFVSAAERRAEEATEEARRDMEATTPAVGTRTAPATTTIDPVAPEEGSVEAEPAATE